MDSNEPLILGHRGASAVAPENTLAAFSQAIQDGADGIEFDVRLSSDGAAVVIHDDTLNRTGLVSRTVSGLTAVELQQIDVGSWFSKRFATETIPSLAAVFDLFASNNGVLYVEMKCAQLQAPALAEAVVRQIEEHNIRERVVVESFQLSAIAEVKKINPRVRTSALFEPRISKPLSTLRVQTILKLAHQYQADEIALHHTLARTKAVQAAKDDGFEVVVWTVDDAAWIERARTSGIKALISNNPRVMVEARNRYSQIRPR